MSTAIDGTGSSRTGVDDRGFFGHPSGLSTLFFTEMWERFSYYGMRAILTLYMTKTLGEGGLGFDEKYAALIYATYVSSVWYLPLIGGWLADRVFGARRAVLIGGIIIACGHYSMTINTHLNFYAGLILIASGTGLLKPNISAMVGQLYTEKDQRRDAGFSIFYMGMNLGLVQYLIGRDRLSKVGQKPAKAAPAGGAETTGGFDIVTIALAVVGGVIGGGTGYYFGDAGFVSALFPLVVGFFAGYLIGTTRLLTGDELKRVLAIFILFVFSILFWMTYEQAGSSLTLFADRLTKTTVFGWQYPSSWFQSVPAIFVIIFAPMFAWLWQRMGNRQPSSPGKFIYGLFFAGIAFVVVTIASMAGGGGRVSPLWLVVVYLLQTFGELCLSPVGLSTVTKLSPARMVGLMMGVWFLSISIGSYIAGLTTRMFEGNDTAVLTRGFAIFSGITLAAALVLAVLTPLIKKLIPREVI